MFTINEQVEKKEHPRKFDDKFDSYEVIIDFNYLKLYE